ncbi:MAG TPA: NAD-dependent epimerase/dehydratase family protein [Opitutaceae bacterium]
MKNEQSSGNAPRCYLVTGAAGFIASKVCEQLLAAGHKVVGIDNLNDYYDVRLKDYRLSRLLGAGSWEPGADPKISGLRSQVSGITHGNFTFHALDIENLPALEQVFQAHKFDAVFNLAARAGVRYSLEFPELYRRTNVLGEENVLKCQVKYGVRKHVLASSSSVYAGCPMPFVEDARLGRMQSPYAETKRQAELLALDYFQEHGLDVTVLRYFTVFGPAGRPDMAPFRFIKWIDEGTPITLYGDGSQARDFTYVDDIALGTVLAGRLFGGQLKPETGNRKPEGKGSKSSGSPDAGPEIQVSGFRSQVSESRFQPSAFPVVAPSYDVINLGGGNNPLSITAMIGIMEAALGKKAKVDQRPASDADMKETWADISKAGRLLGWAPKTITEEGFKQAVDWHLENRDWLGAINL